MQVKNYLHFSSSYFLRARGSAHFFDYEEYFENNSPLPIQNSECGVRSALIRRRFRLRRTPAVALLWRGRSARQVTLA
jgi:hypothetical protein